MKRTVQEYVGKIRVLGNEEVTVSLFDGREGEIVAEIPRSCFPQKRLVFGEVFRYRASTTIPRKPYSYKTTVTIESIPVREPSKKEIADLWEKVQRSVPVGEY